MQESPMSAMGHQLTVPMIGGMVSSTLLTLIVIPAIYLWSSACGCRR
jgi:Cu/Ag efflux pump CusA